VTVNTRNIVKSTLITWTSDCPLYSAF